MANILDILSYPQYEQGGRFNVLSPFQLLYAGLTPRGRRDVEQRRAFEETTRNLAQEQASAGLETARIRRGAVLEDPNLAIQDFLQGSANIRRTAGEAGGQELANIASELRNRIGQLQFERGEEARTGLTRAFGSSPEFIAGREGLAGLIRQGERGARETAEEEALTRAGGFVTPFGLEFQRRLSEESEATLNRRTQEQLSREHLAAQIATVILRDRPDIDPNTLRALFERAGFSNLYFGPSPAAGVAEDIDKRPSPTKRGAEPTSPAPPGATREPASPLGKAQLSADEATSLIKKYTKPYLGGFENVLSPRPLSPGAGTVEQRLLSGSRSPTLRVETPEARLEALRQLETYLSTIPLSRGAQRTMQERQPDLEKVRRLIQALLPPEVDEATRQRVLGAMNLELRK